MDAKGPGTAPGLFACLFRALSDYFFFAAFLAAFFAGAFLATAFFAGAFLAAAFFTAVFFAAFLTANVLPRFVDFLVGALFFFEVADFFATLPPPRVPLLLFLAA